MTEDEVREIALEHAKKSLDICANYIEDDGLKAERWWSCLLAHALTYGRKCFAHYGMTRDEFLLFGDTWFDAILVGLVENGILAAVRIWPDETAEVPA